LDKVVAVGIDERVDIDGVEQEEVKHADIGFDGLVLDIVEWLQLVVEGGEKDSNRENPSNNAYTETS
jgi:hypothetical protein